MGEPARRPALGAARRPLDRRPREAVARDAVSPRRAASRPRSRSAPGRPRHERRSARCSRGSRSTAPRSSPSTPTTGCSTASRRRSTPARSRSSSATPTSRASSRCGRRSRPRSIPGSVDDLLGVAGGRRPDVGIPGFSGAGVTVALLDTGVDLVHPYIRGALLAGLDVLDPGGDASARQNPTAPGRPERHGTEMAGLVAGSGGPDGLAGRRPRRRRCCRSASPAGSRTPPAASPSTAAPISCSPGIELAVDPNEDGDAHDAARIALVGVVEPFAAFTDGPLAAAAAGASALDSLVVAPAGNDGPAGPAYGSIGGPGGAPAALTAGAIDTRRRSPTGHVLLLAGLRVARLRRPAARWRRRSLALGLGAGRRAAPRRRRPSSARPAGSRASSTATATAASRGAAVLLPRGTSSPEAVREVVAAGARAVLVDGPLPAGSLGTDGPADVPILGLLPADADAVRASLRRAIPVTLAVGAAAFDPNEGLGGAAPFSSEGLAFDGGPKPEVSAAGHRSRDLRPGTQRGRRRALRHAQRLERRRRAHRRRRGAARAGAARSRRRRAEAGARRLARDRGVGAAPDCSTRRQRPRSSSSPTRRPSGSAWRWPRTRRVRRRLTLRNVSRRTLDLTLEPGTADAADIVVEVLPARRDSSGRGRRCGSPSRRPSRCCRARRPRSAARCASRCVAARRSRFRGRSRCRRRSAI